MYSSLRVVSTGINADYGQNSVGTSSNAEINRLLSKLNSRLSREVDGMMSSVNTQIHRAISDAIDSQILPQIQTALCSGSGHLTQNRWNVPSERPEINPEENCSNKTRKNSRSEQFRDRPIDGTTNEASVYDTRLYVEANRHRKQLSFLHFHLNFSQKTQKILIYTISYCPLRHQEYDLIQP